MFTRTFLLTAKEKREISEMISKIMLWILEGQSMTYMSDNLKLYPHEIEHNIDETLYTLMKHTGKWRYLKILFRK